MAKLNPKPAITMTECSKWQEVIEHRDPDFPLAVVAGWFRPDGQVISSVAVACDKQPTLGQVAIAHAGCLAAVLKRLQMIIDENPSMREHVLNLVKCVAGGMDVVDSFESGLLNFARAGKGAIAAS